MAATQTTIAVIYDYDQTLSPTYMQDETLFPHFGINAGQFWKKSRELVDKQGYDGELAYLKCMLDYLEMDRPTNDELVKLGAQLGYYKGVPEVFGELNAVLTPDGSAIAERIPAARDTFRKEFIRPATEAECILLFGTIGGAHAFWAAEDRRAHP